MKFCQSCHPHVRTLICIVLLSNLSVVMSVRRKQPDSILEVMNTPEIAKLINQRRLNQTNANASARTTDGNSHRQSQFYLENDLDEEFSESPLIHRSDVTTIENRRYRNPNGRRQQQHPPDSKGHPTVEDMQLLPYNDSLYSAADANEQREAFDLRGVSVDKLLKSSKNALYITRKEYLKKDWCKTEPLIQRIREPGCLTRTFLNRFCYGQCNSFYIPKSPKRRRGNGVAAAANRKHPAHQDEHFDDEDLTGAAFKSCGFCKPKKSTWVTVTLRCPALNPQLRKKRVQRIKQCKCMAMPTD